ncbi:MAG TPA: hypothetical protein VNP72_06765 [Longimicrobium sp.]|nr:hypothetical protein [Longimicrobium sp.]
MKNRCLPLLFATALALLACEGSPTESTGIELEGPTLDALGDQVQLPTTFAGSDRPLEWRSLNPTIVRVTKAGLATAIGHGEALLEATAGTRSAETILTVLPPAQVRIDSLKVTPVFAGSEVVALRLFNAGGRGSFRLEAWGLRAPGDPIRYLQTPWTTAPAHMVEEVLMEVPTPSAGAGDSRIEWLALEYRPATYPDSVRVCVLPNRQAMNCP